MSNITREQFAEAVETARGAARSILVDEIGFTEEEAAKTWQSFIDFQYGKMTGNDDVANIASEIGQTVARAACTRIGKLRGVSAAQVLDEMKGKALVMQQLILAKRMAGKNGPPN